MADKITKEEIVKIFFIIVDLSMIKIVLINSYKTVPKNKWFDKYLLKQFESFQRLFRSGDKNLYGGLLAYP